MKKLNKFGLAALIAAGAMIFGLASCDSGNKEYVAEVPTTWADLEASVTDGDTAKWTFATDTSSIGADEVSLEGKPIAPDVAGTSTLVGGNGFGVKYVAPTGTLTEAMGTSTGRIQASNKTASLAAPENGAMLKLTTKVATNITVRAAGAGAATAARILMITDAADTPLVYKDNLAALGSGGTCFAFHLKGAPAGEYHIYFNGSTIYEIDCTKTAIAEPKPYTKNDDLSLSSAPSSALESLIETHSFTLTDAFGDDVTASAVWKSFDESIATVKAGVVSAASKDSNGTVKIRARIGMYYQDAEVTFKPCEKTLVSTIIGSNLPKKDTKILDWSGDDAKAVLATGIRGIPGVAEVVDETATFIPGEVLQSLKVKSTGTYTWSDADKKYTLTEDATETATGEFFAIKDVSAANGGLAVKDDKTDKTINTGDYLRTGTVLYAVEFKAKPAEGKTLSITGISACLNSGKGAGTIKVVLYKDGIEIGEALSKKGDAVDTVTSFSATDFGSEATFKFEFQIAKEDKTTEGYIGQSVQIQNLAFVCVEK